MNPYVVRLLMSLRQQRPVMPQMSTANDLPNDYGWLEPEDPSRTRMDDALDLDRASAQPPPSLLPQQADFSLSDEDKRLANRDAINALGIALLEGAGRGDYAGSLARGFAAYAQTRHDRLTEAEQRGRLTRQEQRQIEEEQRQSREAEERMRGAQQSRQQGAEIFKHEQTEWGEEDSKRSGIARSAKSIADAVSQAAGPNSPEAQAAQAEAARGADADLGRLHQIHDAAVQRSRREEDAEFKTEAEIEAERERAKYGYGSIAEGRRAEEGLGIQRRQADLYGQSIQNRGTGMGSPGAFNDDVKAEADKRYALKLKALELAHPPDKQFVMRDGKFVPNTPITEADLGRARAEAEREAEAVVRQRYEGGRDTVSIPGDPHPERSLSERVDDVESVVGPLSPEERTAVMAALRFQLPRDVVASIRRRRAR